MSARSLLLLLAACWSYAALYACDDVLPTQEARPEQREEHTSPDATKTETPTDEPTPALDATADTRPDEPPQEQDPEPPKEQAREPQPETPKPDTPEKRWRVKVLSFNIRYGTAPDGDNRWNNRKDLVAQVLLQQQPDIFGLQESWKFQHDALLKSLPGYRCFGRSRDAKPDTGEWVPICYNTRRWQLDANDQGVFWLSQTPEVPGSQSWGSSLPRITTWGRLQDTKSGQSLYVFNTHLDNKSANARIESAKLLARRMAGRLVRSAPVLLMGDFNAGERSNTIRFIRGESVSGTRTFLPLLDTYRSANPKATQVGTIHGFRGTTSGNKIDYIFAITGWPGQRVEAAAIHHDKSSDGRYPSDHFPLSATISYPHTPP